jgi:hypothetical protein
VVGVLVLVDHDVAEALLPFGEHVRLFLEELNGAHEQIVEVQSVGLLQSRLVQLVHPRGRLLGVARCHLGQLGRAHADVLGLGDRVLERARRPALQVEIEVFEDPGDHTLGVLLVVDREVLTEAQMGGLVAQEPGAARVEGHDPHVVGDGRPDQEADALAHLARGLVRERDGQHLTRTHARAQEVGHAVGDDASLARSGAGDDEDGTLGGQNGVALDRVQIG